MKRMLFLMCVLFFFLASIGTANALEFEDFIDYWTLDGTNWSEFQTPATPSDTVLLLEGHVLHYFHDVNDDGIPPLTVVDATLELDFTGPGLDIDPVIIIPKFNVFFDGREFVRYMLEDGAWVPLGEIDTEPGNFPNVDDVATIVLDVDWLNDDGFLDVNLEVFNLIGNTASTATIFLDHSLLTGTAVPEPATMLLVGTGLVGLVGYRRKFRK